MRKQGRLFINPRFKIHVLAARILLPITISLFLYPIEVRAQIAAGRSPKWMDAALQGGTGLETGSA
jgi:hypothetical protein